jgi:hypothetical protein
LLDLLDQIAVQHNRSVVEARDMDHGSGLTQHIGELSGSFERYAEEGKKKS